MPVFKNKQSGFSLIELMIVVAIIGILLAIAYPNYLNYVIKSKRVEAMTEIMHAAQLQEKYFSQKLKYAYDINTLYGDSSLGASKSTENGLYDITLVAADSSGTTCTSTSGCTSYTLTATANAANSQSKDTVCKTFTIAHTGAKSAKDTSNTDSTNQCW